MSSIAVSLANVVVPTRSAHSSPPNTRTTQRPSNQGAADTAPETNPAIRRRNHAAGATAQAPAGRAPGDKGRIPGNRRAPKPSKRMANDTIADTRQGGGDLSELQNLPGSQTPFAGIIKKLAAVTEPSGEVSQKTVLKTPVGAETGPFVGGRQKTLALSSGDVPVAVGKRAPTTKATGTVVPVATQGARQAGSQGLGEHIAKAHTGVNVPVKTGAYEADPKPQASADKVGAQAAAAQVAQPDRAGALLYAQAAPRSTNGGNPGQAAKESKAGAFKEAAVTASSAESKAASTGAAATPNAEKASLSAAAPTPTAPQPARQVTGRAPAGVEPQAADGEPLLAVASQKGSPAAAGGRAPTATTTEARESTNAASPAPANPENPSGQPRVGEPGPERLAAVDEAQPVVSTQVTSGPPHAVQSPMEARAGLPEPVLSDQVTEALGARVVRAGEQVVVRLDPPELGRIRVTFQGEGNELRAIMEVDNAKALSELQREAPLLIQRLADSGIRLRQVEFVLNEPTASQGGDGTYAHLQQGQGFQQEQAGHQQNSPGGQNAAGEQIGTETAGAQSDGEIGDDSINVWI